MAVAGATGALGTALCLRLRARGLAVRALVRAGADATRLAPAGVALATADLTAPESLEPAVAGARCVVSTATCFPRDTAPGAIMHVDRDGNTSLVDAAERAGVERFVFVSNRPVASDFPLQRAKRAVEQRLLESALEPVVLRPGKFMDVWFSPLCGFDAAARRATIFGDGTAPLTWIARDDVAEFAVAVVVDERRPEPVIELGGPEALSQRDVVAIYEEATGAPWTLDTIPADELERRVREPESEVAQSLAALMLEAHRGAVTEMAPVLTRYPLQLTTVREFAAR